MDVLANKDELGANNQLSIKDAPGLQNGDDAVEASHTNEEGSLHEVPGSDAPISTLAPHKSSYTGYLTDGLE